MKRPFTYYLLLTATAVLFTACGTQAQAVTEADQPPDPTPSQPAAIPNTGGGSGSEVVITLGNNTIDSSQTTFEAGKKYVFVITNHGTQPHQFNINEPVEIKGTFQGAISGALVNVPTEQLSPGKGVRLEFTFPDNAVNKTWEFSCLVKNHYEDGMRWAIVVTQ